MTRQVIVTGNTLAPYSGEALSGSGADNVDGKATAPKRIVGLPASRLEAVGNGDADLVGDNRTAQGRMQNLRVQIVVTR